MQEISHLLIMLQNSSIVLKCESSHDKCLPHFNLRFWQNFVKTKQISKLNSNFMLLYEEAYCFMFFFYSITCGTISYSVLLSYNIYAVRQDENDPESSFIVKAKVRTSFINFFQFFI